jgi:hypothetical protein
MSCDIDILILEITEHQVPVIKRDEIDLTLSIRTEPGPGEQSVQILCRDLDAAGIKNNQGATTQEENMVLVAPARKLDVDDDGGARSCPCL